ncbi:serine/threonine-protein kinase [Blastopirellula marina]|uniref:non-specific serine/threonine protein kinase n=1 Tax=Blastopirellula marina TaxID=124 RepID=A0A2S8FA92_9BACT|nr:serine/threonine-protein kinase [Blastopirellula marina]PQO28854.1 hypothetical protein C5Y98_24130 [Blastopirellula marina]PTL42127.1 serine/threonine protein kinase [Blastopirellula marina]
MVARFHYDDAIFERLLQDKLRPQEQQDVTRHIESCTECQTKLETLVESGVDWSELRDYLKPSETSPSRDQANKDSIWVGFLEPSERPDSLGRFGRYEILEVLGRGGTGIVMRGYDPSLDRQSAIKVLSPQLAASAAARKRFSREAKSAAAVVHEHVVPIQTVDQEQGLPYLVMPVLEGRSLEDRIRNNGPLDVKEVLRIGRQIASGLAAAHQQGLVHRDVKPANILLHNGVERVVITDFGLARAVDDASMTQSGTLVGTPQYMSPEQARGQSLDARSDLFSLGSVLYFMLVGHSPFRAETTMGVLNRITNDQPRSLTEQNPEIPAWLDQIIRRLLSKQPEDRYQTAAEVESLLGQWLAHLQDPTGTPRPSEPPPTETDGGSRRRNLLLATVGGFALLLAGIFIVLQTNQGTLTIQSDSGDVAVRITQGDDVAKQLTVVQGDNQVRLAAGKYVVEIEGEHDGLTVKNGEVTLLRGDKKLVHIVEHNKAMPADKKLFRNVGTGPDGHETGVPVASNAVGSQPDLGKVLGLWVPATNLDKRLKFNPTDNEVSLDSVLVLDGKVRFLLSDKLNEKRQEKPFRVDLVADIDSLITRDDELLTIYFKGLPSMPVEGTLQQTGEKLTLTLNPAKNSLAMLSPLPATWELKKEERQTAVTRGTVPDTSAEEQLQKSIETRLRAKLQGGVPISPAQAKLKGAWLGVAQLRSGQADQPEPGKAYLTEFSFNTGIFSNLVWLTERSGPARSVMQRSFIAPVVDVEEGTGGEPNRITFHRFSKQQKPQTLLGTYEQADDQLTITIDQAINPPAELGPLPVTWKLRKARNIQNPNGNWETPNWIKGLHRIYPPRLDPKPKPSTAETNEAETPSVDPALRELLGTWTALPDSRPKIFEPYQPDESVQLQFHAFRARRNGISPSVVVVHDRQVRRASRDGIFTFSTVNGEKRVEWRDSPLADPIVLAGSYQVKDDQLTIHWDQGINWEKVAAQLPTVWTYQRGIRLPERNPVAYGQVMDNVVGYFNLYQVAGKPDYTTYSHIDRTWDHYQFPSSTVVTPCVGRELLGKVKPDFVGFSQAGDSISSLVAIDTQGKFCSCPLDQPFSGEIPCLAVEGGPIVYSIINDRLYAFSGRTATWDSVAVTNPPIVRIHKAEMPKEAADEQTDEVNQVLGIVVQTPEGEKEFTASIGRWLPVDEVPGVPTIEQIAAQEDPNPKYAGLLDEHPKLQFTDVPLNKVIEYLELLYGIKIPLDHDALRAANIPETVKVTCDSEKQIFRESLRDLLQPLGLRYVLRGDQLVITTLPGAGGSVKSEARVEPSKPGENPTTQDLPRKNPWVENPLEPKVKELLGTWTALPEFTPTIVPTGESEKTARLVFELSGRFPWTLTPRLEVVDHQQEASDKRWGEISLLEEGEQKRMRLVFHGPASVILEGTYQIKDDQLTVTWQKGTNATELAPEVPTVWKFQRGVRIPDWEHPGQYVYGEPLFALESYWQLFRDKSQPIYYSFSLVDLTWDYYRFPESSLVTYRSAIDRTDGRIARCLGFEVDGDSLRSLVAIDTQGKFCECALDRPFSGRTFCLAVENAPVLYTILGGRVYAFSGRTGTWDSIPTPDLPDLKRGESRDVVPPTSEDGFDTQTIEGLVVKTADGVHVFTASDGHWKKVNEYPQPQDQGEDVSEPASSKALSKIWRQLRAETKIQFVRTPLALVIGYLEKLHGINMVFDHEALEAAGISETAEVSCDLAGVNLAEGLRSLLEPLKLRHVIRGDQLFITTLPDVQRKQTRRSSLSPQLQSLQGHWQTKGWTLDVKQGRFDLMQTSDKRSPDHISGLVVLDDTGKRISFNEPLLAGNTDPFGGIQSRILFTAYWQSNKLTNATETEVEFTVPSDSPLAGKVPETWIFTRGKPAQNPFGGPPLPQSPFVLQGSAKQSSDGKLLIRVRLYNNKDAKLQNVKVKAEVDPKFQVLARTNPAEEIDGAVVWKFPQMLPNQEAILEIICQAIDGATEGTCDVIATADGAEECRIKIQIKVEPEKPANEAEDAGSMPAPAQPGETNEPKASSVESPLSKYLPLQGRWREIRTNSKEEAAARIQGREFHFHRQGYTLQQYDFDQGVDQKMTGMLEVGMPDGDQPVPMTFKRIIGKKSTAYPQNGKPYPTRYTVIQDVFAGEYRIEGDRLKVTITKVLQPNEFVSTAPTTWEMERLDEVLSAGVMKSTQEQVKTEIDLWKRLQGSWKEVPDFTLPRDDTATPSDHTRTRLCFDKSLFTWQRFEADKGYGKALVGTFKLRAYSQKTGPTIEFNGESIPSAANELLPNDQFAQYNERTLWGPVTLEGDHLTIRLTDATRPPEYLGPLPKEWKFVRLPRKGSTPAPEKPTND